MATHTKEDIDKLMTAIEEIWDENNQQSQSDNITSKKIYVN
jgi:hypothetical protein